MWRLCFLHNIVPIRLPPNSTHLLQLLDLNFFRYFKIVLGKLLKEMFDRNPAMSSIKMSDFHQLLRDTFSSIGNYGLMLYLRRGFHTAGLYPYNPEKALRST